jgi:hypothetical protein
MPTWAAMTSSEGIWPVPAANHVLQYITAQYTRVTAKYAT